MESLESLIQYIRGFAANNSPILYEAEYSWKNKCQSYTHDLFKFYLPTLQKLWSF